MLQTSLGNHLAALFWRCGARSRFSVLLLPLLLQGCATAPPVKVGDGLPGQEATPPAGYFIPRGVFGKSAAGGASSEVKAINIAPAPSAPLIASALGSPPPVVPVVLLYTSATTKNYYSAVGLDANLDAFVWERFLRKYKIAYQKVDSVERLESAQPGVLLLPSAVALSPRERQAIVDFRAKGGGVLSSWLTGVRGQNGEWLGFGFMANTLDVNVVGTTEADEDDLYLMPIGDNPVSHHLPAGYRIWTDRLKEWYPLRLSGRHSAAFVMDWARAEVVGKQTVAMVFDERSSASGTRSRSVVLGYPERLWLASDPKAIEAIAHNALMWLLRQPAAYVAAWPHPYASAFMLAVDANDVVVDGDLDFAKRVEAAGGRATYYVLTVNAKESADVLKVIQSRGHEIGFFGDKFLGFQNQTADAQAKRLDGMRADMKNAGVEVTANAGFSAPMTSYDKTTQKLLMERGYGHLITFSDASDARLPVISPQVDGARPGAPPMVLLPRTQRGPEDELEDDGPSNILKTYLADLDLAEQMRGLSVIRIPNQSLLRPEDLDVFFKDLRARTGRMWMATASQVADWWRERERVSIRLEGTNAAPLLTVEIRGEAPLRQAVSVLVNLPESGNTLRLLAKDGAAAVPKVLGVDPWRAAVVLEGLAPGIHRWALNFDRSAVATVR